MFDIFYFGSKPNLFPFEKFADTLESASKQSKTKFFWYIDGNNDYSKFDFDIIAPPWQDNFIHVWPSQWQSNAGVYFSKKELSYNYHYQKTQHINRLPVTNNWVIPDNVDKSSIDYTWHPNPLDPDYIYHFPSQWQSASGVIYQVPGATEIKLIDAFVVKTLPTTDNWVIPDNVSKFDTSWHPNPLDPDYIYEFGTQWYPEGGPKYIVNDSAEYKYIDNPVAKLLPTTDNWVIIHDIYLDSFDFSWAPHPKEQPYIYVWGNQYWPAEKMPTIEYRVPGATTIKYMDGKPRLKPNTNNWVIPDNIDKSSIDFSWVPDPFDDPYIYEFATQWQPNGGAQYHVLGATEIKYVDIAHRRLASESNWIIDYPIKEFDFSWHPDNTEKPYIYEFATQWQPNGGPKYIVNNATEIKYIDIKASRLPQLDNWEVCESINEFDFSWHPDNTEKPYNYIFGNQYYNGTIMPTVRYLVKGSDEEKYINDPVAVLSSTKENWEILEKIDEENWDFSWRPNPKDPPYIYVFGNQWNPPEYKSSIRYVVPGASDIKYMEQRATRLPHPELFESTFNIKEFDYSWEPNPFDPPMTYIFGNQWNPSVIEPTIFFKTGGTEVKYHDEIVAILDSDLNNWEILDNISEFDFSWRPNPKDPPYIYVFGNQWLSPEQRPALKYNVEGATDIKYIDEPKAKRIGNPDLFTTYYNCEFDYSWEPDPGSPPYNYVFGNQYWPAEIMPTVEYKMDNAISTKFVTDIVATLTESKENWVTITELPIEFEYNWLPDPGSPPYNYVFGNQWYSAEEMPTVEYRVPGATEVKYINDISAKLLPDMSRWYIPEEVNKDNIDFSWCPHPKEDAYIHHFGTEFQMSVGLTYTVPGATDVKFEGEIPQKQEIIAPKLQVLDIFFIDKNNTSSMQRFSRLQEKYPNIQKVRFANDIVSTIKRCITRAKTNKFWVISSENIYDDFDFTWHAQPWQSYMTHVFGSQWQKWSDTYLINRYEFERHTQWADKIEQFPNLNFVKDQQVYIPSDLYDIYYVDHHNSNNEFEKIKTKYPAIKVTRYAEDYLHTFKRIIASAKTEHIWIISSLCNYDKFDFSWQPEPWQKEMIHVFGTPSQPRGNTFYIHVDSFKKQMVELELLDWFNVINYCNEQIVPMLPIPVHEYSSDDLVSEIKNFEFKHPYTWFSYNKVQTYLDPSFWSIKDKKVYSISTGNRTVLVPREAKSYIQTQVYDYPYIEKNSCVSDSNLDIIYISNGEPDAERWYEHLDKVVNYNSGKTYHEIKRVKNVNGRAAAYKAAAEMSTTPWFFAVFAKLEINENFNWDWQPDYFQGPKHYIFNSKNPVNGLEYGHMGMIAYNKKLVLETDNWGLDFTLSKSHAVVPVLSGVAHYNTTAELTWRTAFREAIKLKDDVEKTGSVESQYRLKTWLTVASGNYAEWSIVGAKDAIKYYEDVSGDYEKLLLSFEWNWLQDLFVKKHCNNMYTHRDSK